MKGEVDLVDAMVKTLIAQGIHPAKIMTGVHNAFVHGEVLHNAGYAITQENLTKLFEGFDMSIEALRAVER